MSLNILTELADYMKQASKTADGLREQARLAIRRADEIDEKAAQAGRDAIAIRDARTAYEAQVHADRAVLGELTADLERASSGVLL